MDFRVDWISKHKWGQKISQVLVLLIAESYLYVKDIETHYCIMEELDKVLDLFDDFIK